MSELKLQLVTTGSLESLEQVLQNQGEGLKIKNFSAVHVPERNHYQVQMCVSGFASQEKVVMRLAMEKDIRELTPLRR